MAGCAGLGCGAGGVRGEGWAATQAKCALGYEEGGGGGGGAGAEAGAEVGERAAGGDRQTEWAGWEKYM